MNSFHMHAQHRDEIEMESLTVSVIGPSQYTFLLVYSNEEN